MIYRVNTFICSNVFVKILVPFAKFFLQKRREIEETNNNKINKKYKAKLFYRVFSIYDFK